VVVVPSQLPLLPILSIEGGKSVTYVQCLKDFLASGLTDPSLRTFSENLPGPSIWTELGLDESGVLKIANSIAFLRLIQMTRTALEAFYISTNTKDANDLLMVHMMGGLKTTPHFAVKNSRAMFPSWYAFASRETFKPKGWAHKIPHPASIAAVREFVRLSDLSKRIYGPTATDFPNFTDRLRAIGKDIGKSARAVLPREADDLLDNTDDPAKRHQYLGYLFRSLIKGIKLAKIQGSRTFILESEGLELKIPTGVAEEDLNLFVRCVAGGKTDEIKTKGFNALIDFSLKPPESKDSKGGQTLVPEQSKELK